jgi:hypothetical protein
VQSRQLARQVESKTSAPDGGRVTVHNSTESVEQEISLREINS